MNTNRGVSLVEALVALAVMAFGLLGVVGMQSALRQSADVSKQRSEAVRVAQENIELRRRYSIIAADGVNVAFDDIIPLAATTVGGTASNTDFTLTRNVQPLGGAPTKTVSVDVTWLDRAGQTQSVRLSTAVTAVRPELGATLALPPEGGSIVRSPRGRNAAIPVSAIDQGDGTSRFTPPGIGAPSWIFNNNNGFIESACTGASCVAFNARLVTGFVTFSTGTTQPSAAMAADPTNVSVNPANAASAVEVVVQQTSPTTATIGCYEDPQPTFLAYFCAVPVDSTSTYTWSGRTEVQATPLATSIADVSAGRFRVCRYTPVRGCHPTTDPAVTTDRIWGVAGTVPTCTGSAPTPSRKLLNEEHPLNYFRVPVSLANQNFLVIRAGDGATPFDCPADLSTTPNLVNSNTWHHQPSS